MPSQKKIVFRADGNSLTGLGHLYRLFALIEIYKSYFDFELVTKETSPKNIIPKEYKVSFIPDSVTIEHESEWLSKHFKPSKHIIIADGYQFSSNYQKQIKDIGYLLIYIDDLIQFKIYADVIINHSPNINPKKYINLGHGCLALGTEYAILRPSFLNASKKIPKEFTNPNIAFICFGGADTYNLSLKAAKGLLNIKQIEIIHVVIGAANHHKDLQELVKAEKKIFLHQNLDEQKMLDLMEKCNFAIAPSSTILYELCAVKMPILSGFFVNNQENIYNNLLKEGAIYGGGDFSGYTSQDFNAKIEELLRLKNLNDFNKAQFRLFDGQSPNRFIKLLNDILVAFRKATEKDMLLVYNWSSDILVRQNSYNTEEIALDTHEKWYNQKIKDDKTLFLIALFDNQPAGVVRYEIKEDHSIVGVLVAENFRGKKLSASFLSESAKYYFKQNHLPIFAYIKEENKASIKAFEAAGYSFYNKESVKNIASFVYKLEKK